MKSLRDVLINFSWDWDDVICNNYKIVLTKDEVIGSSQKETLA